MAKTPILVTRGIIVLPYTRKCIEIGRERSIKAINKSYSTDKRIIVVPQIDPSIDNPKFDDITDMGTMCIIDELIENADGSLTIFVIGINYVQLVRQNTDSNNILSAYETFNIPYYDVKEYKYIKKLWEKIVPEIDLSHMFENQKYWTNIEEFKKIFDESLDDTNVDEQIEIISKIAPRLIEYLSEFNRFNILFNPAEYAIHNNLLALLQFIDTNFDALNLTNENNNEKIKEEVEQEINRKVNQKFAKQQREFFLREKLRVIKEELGDAASRDKEIDIIKSKLEANPYPNHVKEKILEELNKYELAFGSQEANVIKTYIDWLINLPWFELSKEKTDFKDVRLALDSTHYGIDKVKERILEYLAVIAKNPNSRSPILCLVGPPGVGKTSLAKSIANALGKEYVQVPLGGVKDESEIRGHRRTYVGSMPGRIIRGMKRAKVLNPLFLLDEIDKMASDYRGDPASALLEVLDPEQNSAFSDNYIELDYDLSKVMFITTANYYNQIPIELIDRLEVIELSSYTANEKKGIAKSHLVKKVLKDCGFKPNEIKFKDSAFNELINYYTREAGVRELQRCIEKIAAKIAKKQLLQEEYPTEITDTVVNDLLGKRKFSLTLKDKTSISGIVNGMAYTSAGGDLLPIEVTYFPGKGNLILTGNLEQTMRESANVALGYVKANAKKFHINSEIFNDIDIHVHVPSGGIPKDGPSAGVTLTTALISSLLDIPVPTKIAMTGEITLRGKVGIIGGVKEKVISAYRAGVRVIFLPSEDFRYLDDVPEDIKNDIEFHLVDHYQEIYDYIFKLHTDKLPKNSLFPKSNSTKKFN